MTRLFMIIAAVVLATAITNTLQAQSDACDSGCTSCAAPVGCCTATACQAAGRCCGGPKCVGKAEMVDVDKHCWKVECNEICVPAVRFPWERGGNKLTLCTLFKFRCDKGCDNPGCATSCCDGGCTSGPTCGCAGNGCATCLPPKCGFVKSIRDLKKETYTTQACEYSIGLVDNGEGGCDSCSAPGCTGCAAAPIYAAPSTAYVIPPGTAPQYAEPAGTQQQPVQQPRPQLAPATVPIKTQPVKQEFIPSVPVPSAKSTTNAKLKLASFKSRLFGSSK